MWITWGKCNFGLHETVNKSDQSFRRTFCWVCWKFRCFFPQPCQSSFPAAHSSSGNTRVWNKQITSDRCDSASSNSNWSSTVAIDRLRGGGKWEKGELWWWSQPRSPRDIYTGADWLVQPGLAHSGTVAAGECVCKRQRMTGLWQDIHTVPGCRVIHTAVLASKNAITFHWQIAAFYF